MARKPITRTLPPVAEVFNAPLPDGDFNKERLVLGELKKAATRLRKRKSQPFYSMREIAGHFNASLRTVARTYEVLEREGLFSRLRGSQTILVGSADSTQKIVRGIIGIPIWLRAFAISQFSRILWMEVEDRLRKNGFVADLIFYRGGEDCTPEFGERLLRHNLNYVLWHTPIQASIHVRLFLRDHGVRQITLQTKEAPTSIFPTAYHQDWQPADEEMAASWRAAGIEDVIIPNPVHLPFQQSLKNFRKAIANFGMRSHLVEGTAPSVVESLRGRTGAVLAFIDQVGAEVFCNTNTELVEQITQTARLAFCRGSVRLPYLQIRQIRVDIVGFSAIEMAERLARDIGERSSLRVDSPHTFYAQYHPQILLEDVPERL